MQVDTLEMFEQMTALVVEQQEEIQAPTHVLTGVTVHLFNHTFKQLLWQLLACRTG